MKACIIAPWLWEDLRIVLTRMVVEFKLELMELAVTGRGKTDVLVLNSNVNIFKMNNLFYL